MTATASAHLAVRTIDPARAAAVGRLLDRLEGLEGAGLRVPCRAGVLDLAAWTAEDEDTARAAARACVGCPALEACRAYVDEHPEPAGTWAGMTWKQRRDGGRRDGTVTQQGAQAQQGAAGAEVRAPAGGTAGGGAAPRRHEDELEQTVKHDDDTTPERRHLALTRDALAVVRAQLGGDQEGAAALINGLDAADVPFMLGSLTALVGQALDAPTGTPPAAFVAACSRVVDDAEAGR